MTATRPPTATAAPLAERPQRWVPRTRSAIEAESSSATIAMLADALAEAERRAGQAESELEVAGAETERLASALRVVREECRHIQLRLPAIEETVLAMVQRGEQERCGLGMLLRRREQERRELAARLRRREDELEQRSRAHADLAEQLAEQQRVHGAVVATLATERERVQQLVAQLAVDTADATARLGDLRAQAAAAVRVADERAATALLGAQETVQRLRADGESRVSEAYADVDARLLAAQLDAGTRVELALQDERESRTAAEARARHLETELAAVRRALAREAAGPSDAELRLRAELSTADGEKAELRTRLALCVHELREREGELERERKLADEAAHWASRVERSLERAAPPATAVDRDIVLRASPGSPASPPRRGPRVRLRHGT